MGGRDRQEILSIGEGELSLEGVEVGVEVQVVVVIGVARLRGLALL